MTKTSQSLAPEARLADQDHARYILSLLAPRALRTDLQTLYTFNLELSQIRDRVSEPIIGHMRVQFWRDALEPMSLGAPPAQPLAQALSHVIEKYALTDLELLEMIDIRDIEIDASPLNTLDDMVAEARSKSGYLHKLATRVLCRTVDPETAEAAVLAGTAWGLVGMIRSVPYEAQMGYCRLPIDLCKHFDLNPTSVAQPDMASARREVLGIVGSKASALLAEARTKTWNKKAGASILIGYLAGCILKHLESVGFDPFDERVVSLTQGHRVPVKIMAGLWLRSWRLSL